MANLTQAASKSLAVALGNNVVAPEVIQAVSDARTVADQSVLAVAGLITATNVSQTIDFASLLVGDLVLHTLIADGTSVWLTAIATAGTLGVAAVVGDHYMVLRKLTFQTAVAIKPIF